jgi:hypothetical protein
MRLFICVVTYKSDVFEQNVIKCNNCVDNSLTVVSTVGEHISR